MPTYVTAVTPTAANSDTGPIGETLAQRTRDIAMKALHLVQDMDFSRKLDTYTKPRRQAGDQVHMNFPAPATIAADTLEPVNEPESADDAQPDEAERVEPVNEAEPVEAEPADEVEVVEAEQTDEAEPTHEAQPDEAAPAGERPVSDPPELPQAVRSRPNDSGGSAATGHKRPRPPP